jgi:cysteine desulfurase
VTIYLDHHASTPCDRRVVEAMLPYFESQFANPHSRTHDMGLDAGEAVAQSLATVAKHLGGSSDQWLITSGATESNNLAIRGAMTHPMQSRRHVITVATEHPAVLDVVARLEREGFRVTILPVHPQTHPEAGRIDLQRLHDAIDDDTAIVSVMLVNNETGVIQPLRQIAEIAHARGAIVHSDATQAVGRIDVDVDRCDVDLLSVSAHKVYGPKGAGLLFVRRQPRRVRLQPIIDGGGQQRGLRSGTINVPAAVGMARAIELAALTWPQEAERLRALRDQFFRALHASLDGVEVNGPPLTSTVRVPHNLNVRIANVEGAALLAACHGLAASSGSACTSERPQPSHVLRALGLTETEARCSLRFGLGRGTDENQIAQASQIISASYKRLFPPH